MFKDKYVKDNQNIIPDDVSMEEIKEKLFYKAPKRSKKLVFKSVLATALAACLILGIVFFAGNSVPTFTTTPEKTMVASVTYDDIYDSLNEIIKEQYSEPGFLENFARLFGIGSDDVVFTDNEAVALESVETTGSGAGSTESSTTNNQVAGVDEADIVKNDGRYIYSISGSRLIITDSNSGDPVKVSDIFIERGNKSIINMYVQGNRLAVIYSGYDRDENTSVSIFSIDDKSAPFEMASVAQSGSYHNSRMIDGKIYLISNHYIYRDDIDRDKPEQYVPCVNSRPIEAEKISMISGYEQPTYLVISAVDILTAQSVDKTAVLGGAENVYCNTEHLYYTFTSSKKTNLEDDSVKYETNTTIVKMSLKDDNIKNLATGTVKGYPLNQFSMDEYNGNLRIVTTLNNTVIKETLYATDDTASYTVSADLESGTSNSLYVLDKDLKVIGEIEDLAKDERVYSVRFDKEVGYFVTFRETDPLFTVDLSNPAAPKVMSALKIPGFSEYLHPFGEGLLFGFGKEATENGEITGLKISMFDVSNPYDVSEADKELIEANWSDASYDHKAIMVDAKKNIIAFTAYSYGNESELYVFGYDKENGFTLKRNMTIEGANYLQSGRFVYIGDYFYLVTQSGITTFALDTFDFINQLNF